MKLFLLLLFGSLAGNISEGYTLFSPLPSQAPSSGYNTYLIDNNEDIIIQSNESKKNCHYFGNFVDDSSSSSITYGDWA